MTNQPPDRIQPGRLLARAGLVLIISLAIISMSFLAVQLIAQLLPTLFPSGVTQ